jgi:hypothetical protein
LVSCELNHWTLKQGFHLKSVAAEIRCLLFTLPPPTFYVSRIKKCVIYSKAVIVTMTAVFFHDQSLIIVTTIDLSIVNNTSQKCRRVVVFHCPAKVWCPCMAWTNFIDRSKTSRPWLYLTKHHQSGSHASIPYLQQCKVNSRNQGT